MRNKLKQFIALFLITSLLWQNVAFAIDRRAPSGITLALRVVALGEREGTSLDLDSEVSIIERQQIVPGYSALARVPAVEGANDALRRALGRDIVVTRNLIKDKSKGIEKLRVIDLERDELTARQKRQISRSIREDWPRWIKKNPDLPEPYHYDDLLGIAGMLDGTSNKKPEGYYLVVSMKGSHISQVEGFAGAMDLTRSLKMRKTPGYDYGRRDIHICEIAPWNRPELRGRRKYFGIGRQFLFRIVDEERKYSQTVGLPVLAGVGFERLVSEERIRPGIWHDDFDLLDRVASRQIAWLKLWSDTRDPEAKKILSRLKIDSADMKAITDTLEPLVPKPEPRIEDLSYLANRKEAARQEVATWPPGKADSMFGVAGSYEQLPSLSMVDICFDKRPFAGRIKLEEAGFSIERLNLSDVRTVSKVYDRVLAYLNSRDEDNTVIILRGNWWHLVAQYVLMAIVDSGKKAEVVIPFGSFEMYLTGGAPVEKSWYRYLGEIHSRLEPLLDEKDMPYRLFLCSKQSDLPLRDVRGDKIGPIEAQVTIKLYMMGWQELVEEFLVRRDTTVWLWSQGLDLLHFRAGEQPINLLFEAQRERMRSL